VLTDQQHQIEQLCQQIDSIDPEEAAAACAEINREFARLFALAHLLRDRISEALLATMRAEQRLSELDRRIRHDALTGLRSRAGMELVLTDWWRTDAARQRLACAALLDITGMGQFNAQHGTRAGDRLIATVALLLDDLVRKDSGYEVAGRFGGQRFMLFFGDTGPRNATSAVERMRQSIEAAIFEYCGQTLHVTASCGVTEIVRTDDIPRLVDRLETTVTLAKQQGRNCTVLDEGQGAKRVEAPEYQVPEHVLQLEEEE
jgi:diguanylate cyclase (GGDEF)-like protein